MSLYYIIHITEFLVNSRSVLAFHFVKEVIIPAPDPLSHASTNAQENVRNTKQWSLNLGRAATTIEQ